MMSLPQMDYESSYNSDSEYCDTVDDVLKPGR